MRRLYIAPERSPASSDPSSGSLEGSQTLGEQIHQPLWALVATFTALSVVGVALNAGAMLLAEPGSVCGVSLVVHLALGAASAGLLTLIRRRAVSTRTLIHLALGYEVLVALAISSAELALAAPGTTLPGGVSFVAVLLVLFPMFVPARLRKTIAAALATAATGPLAAWIYLSVSGATLAPGESVLGSYGPNFFVVLLAMVPSVLLSKMRRQVARAQRLGSYQLEEKIGQGGMGEVWRARHHTLRRAAAIKLMRPEALGARDERSQAALTLRFEREAQVAASLHSPHTIDLYDFGVTPDGTLFHVMELLDGFDLEALVQRGGPLPPARVVRLLQQICDGLWDAHLSGLVHRDIKPANIYVCRYGHRLDFIKILDFGLVKNLDASGAERITQGDATTGTPAYMAPEVALGEGVIDGRADLYALGCVAYWMLTGELVFPVDSPMRMMIAHIQDTPALPSVRLGRALPERLERLVMACLEKDPAARPQSARALAEALEACAAELPSDAECVRRWWACNDPSAPPECECVPHPAPPAASLAEAETIDGSAPGWRPLLEGPVAAALSAASFLRHALSRRRAGR